MKKILVALTFVMFALPVLGADEKPEMFFNCSGTDGNLAVTLATKSYMDGSLKGLKIERKGLYDTYNEQVIGTDTTFTKVNYKPRVKKYKDFEKYVLDISTEESAVVPIFDWRTGKQVEDSNDLSEYALLLPSRSVLEKEWVSVSDNKPGNKFSAYVQIRFSLGDEHTTVPLSCRLNWKFAR